MKRLLAVFLIAAASAANAAEVSGDEAQTAVAGWVHLKAAVGEDFTAQPSSVREYQGKDGKGKYYVVELEGGGFVVTSGDTELNPVIAYSKDGTWIDDVKRNPLLAMLPIDVAAMMAELSSANTTGSGKRLAAGGGSGALGTARPTNAGLWSAFKSAGGAKGVRRLSASDSQIYNSDVRVRKLMTTAWNQGTYTENLYVPNKWPCGCVATAGAQIMKFWNWPQNTSALTPVMPFRGKVGSSGDWTLANGYRTSSSGAYTTWNPAFGGPYEWSKMTDKPSASSSAAYAVSRLTRDVGLSVHMDYASGGSGAQESTLFRRFTDQFGYANAVYQGNLSDDDNDPRSWKRALLASFNAGLPCGVSVPGHSIVADGYGYYGGALYVHFNFGWGGTSDAWYSNPNSGGLTSGYNCETFTSLDSVIYNLYPQGPANCTIVSGRVLDTAGSPVKTGSKTVRAKNTSDGTTYTAASTNSIYALILPAGNYDIGYEYGDGAVFVTNMMVYACSSQGLVNGDDTEKQIDCERSGAYYTNTGSVRNIYDMDLQPAEIAAPSYSTAWGTTFYSASASVSLFTSVSGGKIRYTTDGSEPTVSSALYARPIQLTATTILKAKTFVMDLYGSPTLTQVFTKSSYYGENGLYPDTRAGRAAHWVDEREVTHNATGTWTNETGFVDGKIAVERGNSFAAAAPSKGRTVTIKTKVSCYGTPDDTDYEGVKAGVVLGDGAGFKVYTSDGSGAKRWQEVAAAGVTPVAGTVYDVEMVLNMGAMTYTAFVTPPGGTKTQLVADGNGTFPFATRERGQVRSVDFAGSGDVESVEGSYKLYSGALIIAK